MSVHYFEFFVCVFRAATESRVHQVFKDPEDTKVYLVQKDWMVLTGQSELVVQ